MEENLTKKIKQELRYLDGVAYERNLDLELAKLHTQFLRWEEKQISGFELNELIHKYHQGPARDLYFTYQGTSMNSIRVARAIVDSIIAPSEVSEETLAAIANQINFLKNEEE